MKMKNFIMTIMTALLLPVAFAGTDTDQKEVDLTPIYIREEISIKAGDTRIIPLPRYAYIDRMSLEVKTGFLCGKDSFRVSFDGYSARSVTVKGGFTGYRNKILSVDARAR